MTARQHKSPEDLTDAELQTRLTQVEKRPKLLRKLMKPLIYCAAAGGIILSVVVANAFGIGPIAMVGGCLAVAAGMAVAGACAGSMEYKWKNERIALAGETIDRPGRVAKLATKLREKFIAAMTEGTENKVVVKGPLKFKKPSASWLRI